MAEIIAENDIITIETGNRIISGNKRFADLLEVWTKYTFENQPEGEEKLTYDQVRRGSANTLFSLLTGSGVQRGYELSSIPKSIANN